MYIHVNYIKYFVYVFTVAQLKSLYCVKLLKTDLFSRNESETTKFITEFLFKLMMPIH